jgi:diaminopimelate decarboxylase
MGDSESMIHQKTASMKLIPFLTKERTRFIRQKFGTPVFVYDQRTLQHQAGRRRLFLNPA